jgi:hypothetical protein
MSRLEALPQRIRHDIYRYLLLSDQVRQPPNHILVEDYNSQVSILRVNKNTNRDVTPILYGQNKLVKIQNFYGSFLETGMANHETPFFRLNSKAKTKNFKKHVAEISIKRNVIKEAEAKSGDKKMALLLLHDIPKLARLLRILDFVNFMGFDFKFTLHKSPLMFGPLNTADQEKLFLPFEQMRGVACRQEVAFAGTFDAALVQRVRQAMTQNVAWLRAGAAEINDIALSIKRMGDWAFNMGNADMALAKWVIIRCTNCM